MKNIERPEALSILSPLERPLLRALVRQLPLWLRPDHLTIVGFLGALTVFAAGALANFHPAFLMVGVAGVIINWFGDSLDGTLARFRGIERPIYGNFVDHGCDLFSTILIGAGWGISPFFSFTAAAVVVIGFLLAMACALLRQQVSGVLQISYAGFGPTELRVALCITAISYLVWPPVHHLIWDGYSVELREAIFLGAVFFEIPLLGGFMLIEARRVDAMEKEMRRARDDQSGAVVRLRRG